MAFAILGAATLLVAVNVIDSKALAESVLPTKKVTAKYTLWYGDKVDMWDLEVAIDDLKANVTDDIALKGGYKNSQCVALFDRDGKLLDVFSGDDVVAGMNANIDFRNQGVAPGRTLEGTCPNKN